MPEHDLTVESDAVLSDKFPAPLNDESFRALCVALDDARPCHFMFGRPVIQRAGFDLAGTDRCRIVGEGADVACVVGQERRGLLVPVEIELSRAIRVRERQLVKVDAGI